MHILLTIDFPGSATTVLTIKYIDTLLPFPTNV